MGRRLLSPGVDYSRYERLVFERHDPGILLITLNRPDRYNATDETMHTEIAEVWADVATDPDTRVAVVTGAGRAFCAGGDVEMLERLAGSYERVASMLSEVTRMVLGMTDCEKPIVSAINGAAVGAGLAVALMADISVCAEDARLGDGHTRLGVAAGDHAAIVWPILAGMAKARYYLLTGEMITGAEADRIGLVSMAVPREEVLTRAMEIAGQLAAGPQTAIRWTKRALNQWVRHAGPIFEQSTAMEMLSFLGPDVREGIAALRDKRPPRFPSAD
jgi:enoyl-CoA hydratase